VVLPVPGLPKKEKLSDCGTRLSLGTLRSAFTCEYNNSASSFTLKQQVLGQTKLSVDATNIASS